MNLQYILDSRGKTTGVFIPIQEWEGLKARLKGLEEEELGEQSTEEILQGLQQAVEEMNLVKQGKLIASDAKELLNEL
jgi:guanylate kinase